MFIRKARKATTFFAFASVFAVSCLPTLALAQAGPESGSGMVEQMANFGGVMHATSEACGGYSEEQLDEMKQQQQEMLAQQGMDKASFEQAYSAGMQEAEGKWQAASQAEREAACESIKQQAMGAP